MNNLDTIDALAPVPAPFDDAWARTALARIVEDRPDERTAPRPWWRRTRRRVVGLVAAGVVLTTAGTAVATGGPAGVVKDAILDFSRQPNTTANGLGVLHDPALVARFRTERGIFAFWVATSSRGTICYADADGTWDGQGTPTRRQLEYGCGATLLEHGDPNATVELTRPDQLGGFFKDDAGPLVYGISPYREATAVRIEGTGVDRTLPVRPDSLGFGTALPEAGGAAAVTVSFVAEDGQVLGTQTWVAPVG